MFNRKRITSFKIIYRIQKTKRESIQYFSSFIGTKKKNNACVLLMYTMYTLCVHIENVLNVV